MSRRFQASGLVVSAALAYTLAVSPPASADPDPVVPSRQSVDAAQDLVVDKLRSVASIRADLAAANQQLHDLGVVAEQESEAYNGAVFHWENAEQAVVLAERKASRASLRTDRARSSLVAYLVEQQISGAETTSFSLALTADGPHSLITQMSASAASERFLDARYQRWQAASQLSQVYEVSAEDALTESAEAKQAATEAKQTAVDAVEVQQDAVVTIAARRTGLMQELANAQNISVAVATQRQTGLEQRRQARIAEQRRLELLAEERQERREAAQQAAEVVEQRKQAHRTLLRQERQQRQANSAPATTQPAPVPATTTQPVPVPTTTSTEPVAVPTTTSTEPVAVPTTTSTEPVAVPTTTSTEPVAVPTTTSTEPVPVPTTTSTEPVPVPTTTSTEPAPVPTTTSTEPVPVPTTTSSEPVPVPTTTSTQPPPPPPPPPPPLSPPPPASDGNAQDAIRFATAQIGEPYVWGAAGPSSWDCSGLTMQAWATAGVYLPHYSVAQYAATTPVSASSLRPGDLVFWASNASDPGTIFHVGLYIGDGNMIHAARPGVPVKVESIWYWETPDFFGRP